MDHTMVTALHSLLALYESDYREMGESKPIEKLRKSVMNTIALSQLVNNDSVSDQLMKRVRGFVNALEAIR